MIPYQRIMGDIEVCTDFPIPEVKVPIFFFRHAGIFGTHGQTLASLALNIVVLNGGLGRGKRLWEPSCRENVSKSQLLRP